MRKKTIKIWNSETIEKMKACLETTDWDALTEGVDVSEAADVVASYIQFCESTSVQTKTMKIFPNTKPWINDKLKKLIVNKNK